MNVRRNRRRSFPPMRCSLRLLPAKKPLSSFSIQLPTLTIPAPLSAAPINSPLTPLCSPNGDPPETSRLSVKSARGRRRGFRFYTQRIWFGRWKSSNATAFGYSALTPKESRSRTPSSPIKPCLLWAVKGRASAAC